jgi:alpha 1,2-mannosyltransferase
MQRKRYKKVLLIIVSAIMLILIQNQDEHFDENNFEYLYSNNASLNEKVNACIIILAKNKDLSNVIRLISQFEKALNMKTTYPYIFLNNKKFTDNFKQNILNITNSKVEFGLINEKEWNVPKFINQTRLNESLEKIKFSLAYRQMCRFNSGIFLRYQSSNIFYNFLFVKGFFFRHELTLKYDFFLRLDSDSCFQCNFEQDPFKRLISLNKTYGWLVGDKESIETIPTLWEKIKNWTRMHKINNEINKLLKFISDNNGNSLTDYCIFYNNFEIGSFSVFRNQLYLSYFEYLDQLGGFFYERWVF